MSLEMTDKYKEEKEIEIQIYKCNEEKIKNIKERFKEITSNDSKLKEHFKNTSSAQSYSNIDVAGTIIAGINLRNITNLTHNINKQEEIPYSKEQEELLDQYEDLIMEQKVLGDIFQDLEIEME